MQDELDITIVDKNGITKDSKIIRLVKDDSQNIMMTCCRYLANVCASMDSDDIIIIRKNT
jgi:hypothetical protein